MQALSLSLCLFPWGLLSTTRLRRHPLLPSCALHLASPAHARTLWNGHGRMPCYAMPRTLAVHPRSLVSSVCSYSTHTGHPSIVSLITTQSSQRQLERRWRSVERGRPVKAKDDAQKAQTFVAVDMHIHACMGARAVSASCQVDDPRPRHSAVVVSRMLRAFRGRPGRGE